MGMADEMKSLRENIDDSRADRIKWVEDLRKDCKTERADRIKWVEDLRKDNKQMLNRFGREHKEMAGVLRRDLEAYVTNLRKDCKTERADRIKWVDNIKKETKTLLKGYRTELDDMHDAWIGHAGGEIKRKKQKKTEEEGEESKKVKKSKEVTEKSKEISYG